MLLIKYGYMPNEVRLAFRPLLVQYLFLLPGWCRQLSVDYWKGENECDACTTCQPEYRQAHIQLQAGWLDADPTQRRLEVIHELLHVPMAPMVDEHREAVDRLFVDGDAQKFKETLQEQWRKAFEGGVQDLAFSVIQIPPEALPSVQYREEEEEHPPLRAAG